METYDVAVCGGGPAGFIAAIAAARNGAKTILIERYGFLGGMATLSYVSPITTFNKKGKRIIGGIPLEFVEAMEKNQGADTTYQNGRVPFDPEVYKLVSQRMIINSSVSLLLHSYISACVTENNRIKGVIVNNKLGEQQINAKYFIDCTGDADIVSMAGLPYRLAEEGEELQPMTLWFRLGGVDTDSLENMDVRYDNIRSLNTRIREKLISLSNEQSVPKFGGPWIFSTMRKGEASINMTRFSGDGTNVFSLTEAECKLREDVFKLTRILKENFPEFSNSYIIDTGAQVGIRETRRIDGLYDMTLNDILKPKLFPDTVAKGGHFIDIHKANSREQDLRPVENEYNIPYRSLIPKKSKNLLVAGRSISATREAFASIRVQATCMALGQAAGTASALCCNKDIFVDELDGRELSNVLKKQGAIV